MNSEREFAFNDDDFSFLASLVKQQTGIVLSDHKRNMVYSRLARRLRALEYNEFKDYCQFLQNDKSAGEISNLINSITTNLTHFFREPHHFDHLRDEVLSPLFASQSTQKNIRIWSAGCSSGAEPYSIAMVLDSLRKTAPTWDCKILATDIDSNMLERGKAGIYSKEMTDKVPAAYKNYVQSSEQSDDSSMAEEIKRMITYNQLNLMDKTWPMKGPFDAVFCRNVVIYFDKDTQRILFDRIADLIKPDGWLYIGHSENLNQVCDRFEPIGRTIYRKVA